MCTVTFLPRRGGYCLAMNRDEQRTRVAGLPPALSVVDGRRVLCPSEPGGGTWLALNDAGVTFALINWYSVSARVRESVVSRGEVVRTVRAADSREHVHALLAKFPLDQTNPFRLIAIFPGEGQGDCRTVSLSASDGKRVGVGGIVEWRWDLAQLVRKPHRWKAQQWISSGFDEPTAQRIRARTFVQAQRQASASTLAWLRRLHRSHSPQSGPFSTCMHRADAATVSYTEVAVSRRQAILRYHDTAPCHNQSAFVQLRLARQSLPPDEREQFYLKRPERDGHRPCAFQSIRPGLGSEHFG